MDTAIKSEMEELESAMRLFFQTMKRNQAWAHVTASAGVTIDRPAAYVLHALMASPAQGCRVQDLAAHLGIEAPSVTRKTQELELAGYLKRTRDPNDKRAIGLQITPKGRMLNTKLWKAQLQTISQALETWPDDERKEFIKMFQRFSSDLADVQTTKPLK
jgi:DNA-binding MarR family transcriptional regulator